MARAFLLEPTRLDTSSASLHGEVVTLFPLGSPRDALCSDEFVEAVYEKLLQQGYDEYEDFFIVAGGVVSLVVLVGSWSRYWVQVKLLVYNDSLNAYLPRTLGCE